MPKNVNISEISKIIQSQYTIRTPFETQIPHIYQKEYGYYENKNSVPILKNIIRRELGERAKKYLIEDIYNDIVLSTLPPKGDSWEDPDSNYVCLLNGHFNLDTMELKEFSELRFIPFRLEVNYDPNVSMESWLQFVNSLVGNDVDARKLQEHSGNISSNHYATKRFLYLYGPADSGKSTWLRIIQSLLGKENYSNLALPELGQIFINADIYGKKANFCSDFPTKVNDKYFKNLKSFTGEDSIMFQFKHKDAFKYQSTAKLFFANNEIPNVNVGKADDGFYRRWDFVEFPNSFEPDDTIFAKYTTPEMKSAIFNWMLEGYQRLKKNRWKITGAYSIEEIKSIFRGIKVDKTPVEIFLDECCKIDVMGFVVKSELYSCYCKWSHDKGLAVLDDNAFHRKIKNKPFLYVGSYQPTVDGKQVHAWKGIALK